MMNIKTYLPILFLLCSTTILYAQDSYYWYKGNKIKIYADYKKQYAMVRHSSDTLSLKTYNTDNFIRHNAFREYFYPTEEGIDVSSIYWTILSSDNNFEINNANLYTIPFYNNERGESFGISHLFYVKLKDSTDYHLLYNFASNKNAIIIKKNEFMPLWYMLSVGQESHLNALELANVFYESGLFDAAEPSFIIENSADCANDSHYQSQWALKSTSSVNIHYCAAKDITTGSSSVIVAVLDSGIDTNHPDLSNIYTYSYDTETHGSSVVYDDHGTKSAGIIGASTNNNIGIAGIAPNCPLMSVSNSLRLSNVDYNQQMADGINVAYINGASVINNSWSASPAYSWFIDNAIEDALTLGRDTKGTIVVFSSGNNNYSEVEYPAGNDGVIAVGAVDSCGILSGRIDRVPNSCSPWPKGYEPGSSFGSALSVVAPGTSVWSTTLNGNYSPHGGTSAAAPHVSAVAALMLSVNSNLTAAQVKTIIEKTAQKVGGYNYQIDNNHPNGTWCDSLGYGLVNAHAAVLEAYFYDYTINGNTSVQSCDEPQYSLSNTNVPNGTSFYWETSDNLEIISAQGAPNITVRPIGYGAGWIRANLIRENDTVKKIKDIMVTSGYSTYYNNYATNGSITPVMNSVIAGTFTITDGNTVTINSTIYCSPNAKIVIQPGGKLIVDGGTLTNLCTGKMWNGIYVVGNSYQQQLATYQGTLEIKNNSLIENAEWGIITWNGYDYGTSGGIVKCSNSTFHNNGRAVEFYPYTNHDASNNECSNVSYLKNCNFTIDNNNIFASSSATYTYMIKMSAVNGISIRGCHFSDIRTGSPTRGTAIYLAGAGVNFKPSCSFGDYTINMPCICMGESRNTFSGFTKGISVQNPGSNYTINVFKTDFALCEQGIYTSAVNNYNVTMSNFNLSGVEFLTPLDGYGIYSNNCSGYKVEANNFYTTNTSHVFCNTCGIHMQNSGNNANTIYRNTFEKLDDGIKSINNPGLQVSCNEFSDNLTCDIGNLGSIPSQGTSSVSAGNQFSSGVSNFTSNIALYYYHSGAQLSSNPYYPASTSNNITKIPNITANECEPTICIVPIFPPINPPINPKSSPVSDDITLYESLQQEYDSRLAEYDAAGYGFLLENFDEEDADIVALARLKQDTLITIHRAMAEIANRNIDAILQDTLVFDRESLNGWYNRINTQTAKYSLVNSYFEVGEYALARQELASIPQRFALTTDELAEYDNFCQYQSLRESVYASGRNYAQFTETEIAELQTIAERNTGVSSAYANSVLCFFYGICRDEELDLDFDMDAPMNSKSTTAVAESDAEQLAIYVYPNPADEELNILLNSLPEGRTTIEFHDVTGRLVLSEEIKGNSTSINISSLRQGVYMYRIVNGDNVIARDRIVKE